MMIAQSKPLAEVTHEALKVLIEKLGLVNTLRFIDQLRAGCGEYVMEKEAVFGDKTLDALIDAIKESRKEHPRSLDS
jgi:hypothetical protein